MANELIWKENSCLIHMDHNFLANLTHGLDTETLTQKYIWMGLHKDQPAFYIVANTLPDCQELGLRDAYMYVAVAAPAWRKYFKGGLAGEPFFTSLPITNAASQSAALRKVKQSVKAAVNKILADKAKTSNEA